MESKEALDRRIQNLKSRLQKAQRQEANSKHNKVNLATIQGKTYTLQELSREYGFALHTLQKRYDQGKRDDELIRPMNDDQSPAIMFNGEERTLNQLSQEYGLDWSTLYNRYYRYDQRGDDLVRPVNKIDERRVSICGKIYSLQELSQIYHIDLDDIKERYYQGKRGSDLIHSTRTSPLITYVPMNGHVYDLWELSQMYHIQYKTIQERFYHYHRRGKDLVQIPHFSSKGKQKGIIIDGKTYNLTQIAHHYHLHYATVTARYRQGKRGKELVQPIQSSHYLLINGKQYDIYQISREHHLPVSTIRYRYYNGKRGWELLMPKQKHSAPAKVIIDQKAYTLSELDDLTHIKYSTLSNRYYNYHLRGKDLLHPPFLNTKINAYGQTFTVPQLARRYGRNVGTIIEHIQKRYQRGERGYGLISDIEDNYGAVVIDGHHYTTRQLAYKYHLRTSTIYQRYYQRHLRGEALIRPEENPNQLSLTDTNDKGLNGYHPTEKTSEVHTQGAIISQPAYRTVDGQTPILTFMLFSTGIHDRQGDEHIINCVAFDQKALQMQGKISSTDVVKLSGQVHSYDQRDNNQAEFIIHDFELLSKK